MTDQPTTKPGDLVYEDTGANAPLVYFDIVGAYGTMNGSIEIDLAPGDEAVTLELRLE